MDMRILILKAGMNLLFRSVMDKHQPVARKLLDQGATKILHVDTESFLVELEFLRLGVSRSSCLDLIPS